MCVYIFGLVIQILKSSMQPLASNVFIGPASYTVLVTTKELQMRENHI